ncbi:MAG: methyltransferase domain-containing protein [Alphaproteobacteria bacterium]|nr:methyltransferase domain-containing protein [Alphaproteobacteria bacterium]
MQDSNQIIIFDRAQVRQNRQRAAKNFERYSQIFDETAERLAERAKDVKRPFAQILDLGGHTGKMGTLLKQKNLPFLVATDISEAMARRVTGPVLVADEEHLPFAPQSFDLVLSNLSLHWVNDLPGVLSQIHQILKPGGLFLATLLGGETLHELRICLRDAEIALTSGASPRLSPMIELPRAGELLARAGFHLPVADRETLTLAYQDMFALMRDLRGMGETNALRKRRRTFTRRQLFTEAARLYASRFPSDDGSLTATFEVIFLHVWKEERFA